MSFKRDGQKPPRPPPPRTSVGSKFGSGSIGISFKALEEEEDEDLTIFTGKFDKVVEEAHKSQRSGHERKGSSGESKLTRTGSASIPDSRLTRLHSGSKSLDDGNSSPTKKSFFEYKEIITGLKDKISDTKEKITDTINKKIEEFSGDSSSNPSPENEQPGDGDDIIPIKVNILSEAPPEKEEAFEDGAGCSIGVEVGEPVDNDEEGNTAVGRKVEDDDITVIDEYFSVDSMEDFSASPGLNVSVRQRSKLNRLVKKNSKPVTSAKVSMSTLIDASPAEEQAPTIKDVTVDDHLAQNPEIKTNSEIDNLKNSESEKPTLDIPKPAEKTVPVQKMVAIGVCVFAYLIVPLPSYLSGLLMGGFLASVGWVLYLWYKQPPKQHEPF